jgi:hypothetical protein
MNLRLFLLWPNCPWNNLSYPFGSLEPSYPKVRLFLSFWRLSPIEISRGDRKVKPSIEMSSMARCGFALGLATLLFSFQNCAVQQSEDRAALDSVLLGLKRNSSDCLPYLSTSAAAAIFASDLSTAGKNTSDPSQPSEHSCSITTSSASTSSLGSAVCTIGSQELSDFQAITNQNPSNTGNAPSSMSSWTWPPSASSTGTLVDNSASPILVGIWFEQDVDASKRVVVGLAAPAGKSGVTCQFTFTNSADWSANWGDSSSNDKRNTALNRIQALLQAIKQ